MEVTDIQSKASMQAFPSCLEKKRQLTNMHIMISPTVMCSLGDVTESAKIFTKTLKECNMQGVQIPRINRVHQMKIAVKSLASVFRW